MQAPAQPYEKPLALGDLVSLRNTTPELTVSVLHRVHGSSLWEPIETGQRIRVAPKIGKNLKVVVTSSGPSSAVFEVPPRPEACQLLLLQNVRFDANAPAQKEAFRVGSPDGNRCVEITVPAAPLQPQAANRLEFDAKLLALHKGFRFFARLESPVGRVLCGASPEFVAHNSGSSRDTAEPKRKAVKPKAKRKPQKGSMPITPPDFDNKKEEQHPSLSDSSETSHTPPNPSVIVELPRLYPTVKEEIIEDDPWIVVGTSLDVDGRVLAYSCASFSKDVSLSITKFKFLTRFVAYPRSPILGHSPQMRY